MGGPGKTQSGYWTKTRTGCPHTLAPSSALARAPIHADGRHSPYARDPNHRLVKVRIVLDPVGVVEHGLARALAFGLRDRPAVPVHGGLVGAWRSRGREVPARRAAEERACGGEGAHGFDRAVAVLSVVRVAREGGRAWPAKRNGRVTIGCDCPMRVTVTSAKYGDELMPTLRSTALAPVRDSLRRSRSAQCRGCGLRHRLSSPCILTEGDEWVSAQSIPV